MYAKSTQILEAHSHGGVSVKERMIRTILIPMNSFHLMAWMSGSIICWSSGQFLILVSQVRKTMIFQLAGLQVELVSQGLNTLGSVGIVGLYATIIVSLGALLRKLVPVSYNIIFMTLSDPLPLLQLINIMEVCRVTDYP